MEISTETGGSKEPPGNLTGSGALCLLSLGRSWKILASDLPCLCLQPDLVERLISVDIGPGSTTPVSEFSAYISAMKEVKVPAGLSRSAARQLADDQLQPVVKVGNPVGDGEDGGCQDILFCCSY